MDFKSLSEFIGKLASNEKYALSLMRMIAADLRNASFTHFRMEYISAPEDIKIVFKNTSSSTAGINMYASYEITSNFAFEKYLTSADDGTAAVFKSSMHAVSFPSNRGNMLVIPRGPYVNFYDFASNALPEEITDFWKHVGMLMSAFDSQSESFLLASHAGSEAAQSVFHFHLRFEFRDKDAITRIKEKL